MSVRLVGKNQDEVHISGGSLVTGFSQLDFADRDGQRSGTLDGRGMTLASDGSHVVFADGKREPPIAMRPEVVALFKELQEVVAAHPVDCSPPPLHDTLGPRDESRHGLNGSPAIDEHGCSTCADSCNDQYQQCVNLSIFLCAFTGPLWGWCVDARFKECRQNWQTCLMACPSGGTCCPKDCGSFCCPTGSECLSTSGLCCPPPQKACIYAGGGPPDEQCCLSPDQCMPHHAKETNEPANNLCCDLRNFYVCPNGTNTEEHCCRQSDDRCLASSHCCQNSHPQCPDSNDCCDEQARSCKDHPSVPCCPPHNEACPDTCCTGNRHCVKDPVTMVKSCCDVEKSCDVIGKCCTAFCIKSPIGGIPAFCCEAPSKPCGITDCCDPAMGEECGFDPGPGDVRCCHASSELVCTKDNTFRPAPNQTLRPVTSEVTCCPHGSCGWDEVGQHIICVQ